MKKSSAIYLVISLLIVVGVISVTFYSCEKDVITPLEPTAQNTVKTDNADEVAFKAPEDLCGKVTEKDIFNPRGTAVGRAYIFNTDKFFYVYLLANEGFEMRTAYMDLELDNLKLPLNDDGNPDFSKFKHIIKQEGGGRMRTFKVPVAELHDQSYVAVAGEFRKIEANETGDWFKAWVDGKEFGASLFGKVFSYTEQECTINPENPPLEPVGDVVEE